MQEEIESFKVNGKITLDTQHLWLQSKGILSRGIGIYIDSWSIIYPRNLSEIEVSQRYKQYERVFNDFITGKLKAGLMGVKKDEINEAELASKF